MPHLVLLYTPDLEAEADMPGLCRALADCMLEQRDDTGKAVFPTGGTRVLAYPAAHCAVADGNGNYGFLYANLRMGTGRSAATHKAVGDNLLQVLTQHLSPVLAQRPVGITLQIDESSQQVYDAKHSTLHPLFNRPA
ncbi:5-carboxymethyl-2-hydroxymuconate Delta-isomerase [Pseudomonas sp. S60]|uniref:5-carboxymethyl-2-hydroxymuconate isomerase n=1 Tax=unclassified Pseudomonas TaxID=196821 RepID=UPI0019136E5E|nr:MULTISPECIES: 5-carboxymethyl-2-hydroxymuconate isomerase [unclassified Pseudomonas]MBK5005325.1 5-carboxymethyl-2-hydroxymuconate Delta-isomerase [Pseudomonas sp. S32]MBK5011539.1 5-carboxymethyl-2-hydroxymuconate Delta-isomerase [Pseudomonas sp. S60]